MVAVLAGKNFQHLLVPNMVASPPLSLCAVVNDFLASLTLGGSIHYFACKSEVRRSHTLPANLIN